MRKKDENSKIRINKSVFVHTENMMVILVSYRLSENRLIVSGCNQKRLSVILKPRRLQILHFPFNVTLPKWTLPQI